MKRLGFWSIGKLDVRGIYATLANLLDRLVSISGLQTPPISSFFSGFTFVTLLCKTPIAPSWICWSPNGLGKGYFGGLRRRRRKNRICISQRSWKRVFRGSSPEAAEKIVFASPNGLGKGYFGGRRRRRSKKSYFHFPTAFEKGISGIAAGGGRKKSYFHLQTVLEKSISGVAAGGARKKSYFISKRPWKVAFRDSEKGYFGGSRSRKKVFRGSEIPKKGISGVRDPPKGYFGGLRSRKRVFRGPEIPFSGSRTPETPPPC